MTSREHDPASDRTVFLKVARDEAEIVTARRLRRLDDPAKRAAATAAKRAAAGAPAAVRTSRPRAAIDPATWTVEVRPLMQDGQPVLDDCDRPVPCMTSAQPLVGLSLSGGGVRSASFSLGVLQGLDAVVPDDGEPQILDAVDYLSTVSGGGYMGASLITGMMKDGRFPFTSKFDQMETDGTQHLRDHSNYLAPSGGMDWVVGSVVLLRGLLINALLVFGLVFLACSVTVSIYSNEGRVGGDWVPGFGWIPVPFVWTGIVLAVFVLLQLPIVAREIGLAPSATATLDERERVGTRLARLFLAVGLVLALDLQSFVIHGLFDADHLSACRAPDAASHVHACRALAAQTGWLGQALSRVGLGAGAPWGSLAAAVTALGAFGTKLVKVAGATFGDRSRSGFVKHWGSRAAIAVGSLLVPLGLWAVYLSLCFAAIQFLQGPANLACCGPSGLPGRPDGALGLGSLGLAVALGVVGAASLAACCFLPANANSLHGYYRDRLSRAFLWAGQGRPCEPERAAGDGATPPIARWLGSFLPGRRAAAPDPGPLPTADTTKLSHLASRAEIARGGWVPPDPEALPQALPYLIVNAAVNLEGSKYTNRRGRNADSFVFSPLYSGSGATDYVATSSLEDVDPHLDLATAMAVSGAAASANMGASTIRPLTFSLAVLNVRLGYWLPNPRRLAGWSTTALARLDRAWPTSFLREAAGRLDERSPMVYLTDGGHFDNLGIYELLKRRCKIIVATDAEADPPLNFEALIRLERCARIDLGVRIDLPWEELRRWSLKVTVEDPHGPEDDPSACVGPHVALGRIQYTDDDIGVLIYIKACISGDENDLIRDYRRRNPDFPHETTLDQFFTEEQFEVYRALGFHAARSFFTGQDRFGFSPAHGGPAWSALVGEALKRLNVPDVAAATIVAQQSRKTARDMADVT